MKTITKTAIRFIKNINGNKTFEAITEYLKTKGCAVNFFIESERELLADKHELASHIVKKDAFTVLEDDIIYIYILSEASPEDKLYLLLHEVGHIELKHLSTNALTCNIRLHDIEADAFAYTVLNPPKSNKLPVITAVVLTAILSFTSGVYSAPKAITAQVVPSAVETVSETEYVYITRTGEKYHRKSCIHVKGKECTKLLIEEVQKNYEPCSVCNP